MTHTIRSIARALGAEAEGDLDLAIARPAEPARAGPDDLALAMDPRFAEGLAEGGARAAILWPGADWRALGLSAAIFAPRPRYVLAGVTSLFAPPPASAPGIHPTAIVDPSARLGDGVSIGPFSIVEAGAEIGAGSTILSHVVIGAGAAIGPGALIHARGWIGPGTVAGPGLITHPGAIVGADGFSFVTPQPGAVEAARATGQIDPAADPDATRYVRIASLGRVILGADVEIGANACIDRGTIVDTVIGDGTKIDNQVQIGHNCRVGSHCLLCGQAGVAGSVTIGDRVVLGGKAGIADHITIGSDVVVAGASGVSSNIPSGRVMMGNPAVRMDLNVEIYKALRRLPRLVARVAELEKRVSKTGAKD